MNELMTRMIMPVPSGRHFAVIKPVEVSSEAYNGKGWYLAPVLYFAVDESGEINPVAMDCDGYFSDVNACDYKKFDVVALASELAEPIGIIAPETNARTSILDLDGMDADLIIPSDSDAVLTFK